jgi:hypothetical protein
MLVLTVAVTGCGGSSGASATPAAPATLDTGAATPTPAAPAATPVSPVSAAPLPTSAQAAATCPTAATVGGALGVTVAAPVGVAGGGSTKLPAGAKGLACEYGGVGLNVIIELISGIDPSSISLFSSNFPVPYQTVSGVGDQARSFLQTLGAGKDNEGVVATKGSNLVAITATATPASLGQVEALVNQLL